MLFSTSRSKNVKMFNNLIELILSTTMLIGWQGSEPRFPEKLKYLSMRIQIQDAKLFQ